MFQLVNISSLHPCKNFNPNRVTNCKQYLNELNIQGFDFSYGFKCSDVDKFDDLNNLSVNVFELFFFQDQNNWRHKLIPIEISKKIHIKLFLAIYKSHYILIKKIDVFLGDHNKKFICRHCLSSYSSEIMLLKHKQNCGDDNITIIKTSNKSHLQQEKHFHKNPLIFRIYAVFEADKEKKILL